MAWTVSRKWCEQLEAVISEARPLHLYEIAAEARKDMADPARVESVDDEEEEMNLMETGEDGVFIHEWRLVLSVPVVAC